MGRVSATRLLAVLALTAVLAAGCGNGSSSSDGASSGGDATTAASGALELRPVYAHYTQGGPLGRVPLGPSVPQDLLSAMKGHDCSSQPAELQGMLLVCDSDHTVYLLKDPIVSGGVASATPKDTGHHQLWFLEVALDPDATSTLAQATQSMPGTELAFVVDDKVLSAPIIDASMADGHLGITGDFDQAQATSLAQQITTS
jgi:preprotein translocase subunit SecD